MNKATTIGEEIRQRRRAKKLTQTALAELVGVRQASVAGWESGKKFPTCESLTRLAAVLGPLTIRKNSLDETSQDKRRAE